MMQRSGNTAAWSVSLLLGCVPESLFASCHLSGSCPEMHASQTKARLRLQLPTDIIPAGNRKPSSLALSGFLSFTAQPCSIQCSIRTKAGLSVVRQGATCSAVLARNIHLVHILLRHAPQIRDQLTHWPVVCRLHPNCAAVPALASLHSNIQRHQH